MIGFIILSAVIIVAIYLYWVYQSNGVEVEVKLRSVVVMRNTLQSKESTRNNRVVYDNQEVYGLKRGEQGISFWPPWWVKDEEVNLNLERMLFGATSSNEKTKGLHLDVKSKDGIALKVQGSYDILIGRPWNRTNGDVLSESVDDVTEDNILSVINEIDYEDHQSYVAEKGLNKAIDDVFGAYEAKALMRPDKHKPAIPHERDILNMAPAAVDSIAARDRRLAETLEHCINFRLKNLGLSVIHVAITDVSYADPKLQETLERDHRLENLAAASEKLTGQDLSDAEKLAAGTDQFGQVAQAEGVKQTAKALKGIAGAVVEAMREYKKT